MTRNFDVQRPNTEIQLLTPKSTPVLLEVPDCLLEMLQSSSRGTLQKPEEALKDLLWVGYRHLLGPQSSEAHGLVERILRVFRLHHVHLLGVVQHMGRYGVTSLQDLSPERFLGFVTEDFLQEFCDLHTTCKEHLLSGTGPVWEEDVQDWEQEGVCEEILLYIRHGVLEKIHWLRSTDAVYGEDPEHLHSLYLVLELQHPMVPGGRIYRTFPSYPWKVLEGAEGWPTHDVLLVLQKLQGQLGIPLQHHTLNTVTFSQLENHMLHPAEAVQHPTLEVLPWDILREIPSQARLSENLSDVLEVTLEHHQKHSRGLSGASFERLLERVQAGEATLLKRTRCSREIPAGKHPIFVYGTLPGKPSGLNKGQEHIGYHQDRPVFVWWDEEGVHHRHAQQGAVGRCRDGTYVVAGQDWYLWNPEQ